MSTVYVCKETKPSVAVTSFTPKALILTGWLFCIWEQKKIFWLADSSCKAAWRPRHWVLPVLGSGLVLGSLGRARTYRVLFAVFTQHLRGDPAFSARHARAAAEAVPAHCQLLAQPKVWNHGLDLPMSIGHRDEDVVGLQVPVDCYKHSLTHSGSPNNHWKYLSGFHKGEPPFIKPKS